MCYRCEVCSEVVNHGMPEKRHITYRKVPSNSVLGGMRLEIAREKRVCETCYNTLGSGKPVTTKSVLENQVRERQLKALKENTYYTDTRGISRGKGNDKEDNRSKGNGDKEDKESKEKRTLETFKYTKPKHDKKNQQKAKSVEPTHTPTPVVLPTPAVKGKSVIKNGQKSK